MPPISNATPRVSVVIPTHNRPHLLPRAINSAQSAGTLIEVIVVDDASTDETAVVCQKIEGIKYVRLERNQGTAGARNIGVLASTAEYIAFLDDDDLRLPNSLDLQLDALDSCPAAGFVCGGMIIADQDYAPTGEISQPNHPGGDVFWELLELDFPVMPLAVVIRKDCFFRVGLLNRWLRGIDDWDLLVRIAELYPALVMSQPVGIYRLPTPTSCQGSSSQAGQLERAARHQRQLLRLPRASAAPRRIRREVRRRTLARCADTLLLSGARLLYAREYHQGLANIWTGLRLYPQRALRPAAYRQLIRRMFNESQPEKGSG